jgi:hypothetical protein
VDVATQERYRWPSGIPRNLTVSPNTAVASVASATVYWPMAKGSGPLLFLREGAVRASASKPVMLARSIFA